MILFQHMFFTKRYWELYKIKVISFNFFIETCKWLGGFWLVIEPVSYFSTTFENAIKPHGLIVLSTSVLFAIIHNRPRLKFKYFIKGKNVFVNIVIGDIFKIKNKDIVIPTNIHFVTEIAENRISEKSVQGQFTNKYFDSRSHLDSDIANSLNNTSHTVENPIYLGKDKVYELGTVAKFPVKKKKKLQQVYLFALAKLNEHGVCQSDIGEFQRTLPSLWNFIYTKGGLPDLAMPILGSGFCRIDATHEELFEEILDSFLVATRNSKFCKSLTFVVYYNDVAELNIDMESIKEYARFHTSTFSKESRNDAIQGQAIN